MGAIDLARGGLYNLLPLGLALFVGHVIFSLVRPRLIRQTLLLDRKEKVVRLKWKPLLGVRSEEEVFSGERGEVRLEYKTHWTLWISRKDGDPWRIDQSKDPEPLRRMGRDIAETLDVRFLESE